MTASPPNQLASQKAASLLGTYAQPLTFERLCGRLKRMRATGAVATLESLVANGGCTVEFAKALACGFTAGSWGSESNRVVRAGALELTNPKTGGQPSVPVVAETVVRVLMEEGARRTALMMSARIQEVRNTHRVAEAAGVEAAFEAPRRRRMYV